MGVVGVGDWVDGDAEGGEGWLRMPGEEHEGVLVCGADGLQDGEA